MLPEEIPQDLIDILDERAGKAHSRTGPVVACLAEILTRYDEMRRGQGVVREEWRVSGDPGPSFGFYNFVWPRSGHIEDGEEQARTFYNLVTDGEHVPWDDGPHLHHRTIYTEVGPWLSAKDLESRSTDAD